MKNLKEFCEKIIQEKGLDKDTRYLKRLSWEISEIENQKKESYFIDLFEKKKKYSNQNNLLVPFLLGIVQEFNIEKDPEFFQGDMPDIDTDYLPAVRDYLKNIWAIERFGEDKVCNIGNYTTFGIKSSLIDMAKVYGESRDEILNLTKNLQNKDEEGKPITWETALNQDPNLKKYCEDKKEVATAAKKLIDRNRGMGVHAGGLIISSIPINDLVPLVKRGEDPQASSWVEGLHGQDLQPVGLVKFDLLVISNLLQIAHCCQLIRERLGINKICALPGKNNWSDVDEYRNNKKSLEMADKGDLKCIFQFDSDGIRSMVKKGGVTKFEDLVAYSALWRPGPLNCKMHERYIERKRGREEYNLHPILAAILNETYGVIIYQEQVIKILNSIGNIPMKDCELVRKAISKKKVESFIKYKEQFLKNGKNNLNCSKEEVEELWRQIESFAEYGFNKSHAVAYTHISSRLLYLKSHFPHEFYTAILKSETDTDKIKEYKKEIKNHNIELRKLDINKSSSNFSLIDNAIYFGFSNIKGIGKNSADKIVEAQPFSGFLDFLERFGTDTSVLKPLLASRCFEEDTPINLLKFAEYYKMYTKKKADSKSRYEKNNKKNKEELIRLINLAEQNPEIKLKISSGELSEFNFSFKETTCQDIKSRYSNLEIDGKNAWKIICKVLNKINSSYKRYKEKEKQDKPCLEGFDFNSQKIDEKIEKEFSNIYDVEKKFYGFGWEFKVENSPDYKGGFTLEKLLESEANCMPVEAEILGVVKKKGKKTEYYQVKIEDANGDEAIVNIWKDDFLTHQEDLKQGNLIRIRLNPPTNGFKTYTLENIGPKNYFNKIKISKNDDYRIIRLKEKGEKNERIDN